MPGKAVVHLRQRIPFLHSIPFGDEDPEDRFSRHLADYGRFLLGSMPAANDTLSSKVRVLRKTVSTGRTSGAGTPLPDVSFSCHL